MWTMVRNCTRQIITWLPIGPWWGLQEWKGMQADHKRTCDKTILTRVSSWRSRHNHFAARSACILWSSTDHCAVTRYRCCHNMHTCVLYIEVPETLVPYWSEAKDTLHSNSQHSPCNKYIAMQSSTIFTCNDRMWFNECILWHWEEDCIKTVRERSRETEGIVQA